MPVIEIEITLTTKTPSESFDAGFDCGINGSNEQNCHFTLFCTKTHTAAWDEGKKAASRQLADEVRQHLDSIGVYDNDHK